MSGLFGGLLFIVDILGGVFLYSLIGKNAWKDFDIPDSRAKSMRLFFGSLCVSYLIGLIILTLVNWTKMPTSSPQVGMAKFGEGQDGKMARRQDGKV